MTTKEAATKTTTATDNSIATTTPSRKNHVRTSVTRVAGNNQDDVPIFQLMDLILNRTNCCSNSSSSGLTKQTCTNLHTLMHRGIMTTSSSVSKTRRSIDDNDDKTQKDDFTVCYNRIICSALLDRCRQLDHYSTIISSNVASTSTSHTNTNNSNNQFNVSITSRVRSNSLTSSSSNVNTASVGTFTTTTTTSCNASSSFLRRVLSIQSNSGGEKYTPLHTAAYHQDIKMIFYLLHEIQTSMEYDYDHNHSISSTTTNTSKSRLNQKAIVPLKHLVGMLLRQREPLQNTTTTSKGMTSSNNNSNKLQPHEKNIHHLFQKRDADGYTPGALLVQTQRQTLCNCRQAIMNTFIHEQQQQQLRKKRFKNRRSSSTSSNLFVATATVTTPSTIATTPTTTSDYMKNRRLHNYNRAVQQQQQDDEVDDPDSFQFLSTGLRQLTLQRREDEQDGNDDGDDDDSHSTSSSMEGDHHANKADQQQHSTYGCEVLTYGSAHHCVLGVGKVSNSAASTSTASTVVPTIQELPYRLPLIQHLPVLPPQQPQSVQVIQPP